jgi:hypothetical protein
MWRESQLQVGCTNTNHLQMTHDGSGLHTAAPRFAIPQKLTKVSVSEFSMILTCGFPKVLLAPLQFADAHQGSFCCESGQQFV